MGRAHFQQKFFGSASYRQAKRKVKITPQGRIFSRDFPDELVEDVKMLKV